MITVAILYGGRSGEHEVSCRSAFSVLKNIDRTQFDPLLIGISKSGQWFLQEERKEDENRLQVREQENRLISLRPGTGFFLGSSKLPVDFVFPVLHGTFGEDGTVQGMIECLNLPYAGAGVFASSCAMDKEMTKRLWIEAGLPVIPYIALYGEELPDSDKLEQFIDTHGYPLFIKPARSGSSVGVNRCDYRDQLESSCNDALQYDTKIIIEKGVTGKEIECSVVGNRTPEAYLPGEIAPSHGFYDYEAKYIDPDGAALIIPADITPEEREDVRTIAVKAYCAVETEGMARVDFFISGGKPVLNEINTIPGFTNISMFSKMCDVGGLPYAQLLTKIIELGMNRFRERDSLSYSYVNKVKTEA